MRRILKKNTKQPGGYLPSFICDICEKFDDLGGDGNRYFMLRCSKGHQFCPHHIDEIEGMNLYYFWDQMEIYEPEWMESHKHLNNKAKWLEFRKKHLSDEEIKEKAEMFYNMYYWHWDDYSRMTQERVRERDEFLQKITVPWILCPICSLKRIHYKDALKYAQQEMGFDENALASQIKQEFASIKEFEEVLQKFDPDLSELKELQGLREW